MKKPETTDRKASILVVDDTLGNASLLSRILEREGYEARPALCGADALAACAASPPDLLLLDIDLPDIDGVEVCRRLLAEERTRDLPVIFISGLDAIGDKMSAFEAGGVDYITKPFRVAEVLARVGTQLTLLQQRRELDRQRRELMERYQQIQSFHGVLKGYLSRRAWETIERSAQADAPYVPTRERLTILVTDIAGFSRLSEQHDPAPLVADLALYFALIADVVYRHQGEVDKYLGDGMLAFFKDPRAAFEAACQMQRAVYEWNARQLAAGRLPFPTRLGLATGGVVLARIGSAGRQEVTVVGGAVNLAARLQGQADPGGILMDDATYAAAGAPEGATCTVLELKNISEPVTAWSVAPASIEPAGAG